MDFWLADPALMGRIYMWLFSDLRTALLQRLWGSLQERPPSTVSGRSPSRPPGLAQTPTAFDDLIQEAAARYQVDPDLVKAVIRAESNFDPTAVSHAGAKGLMQLMDATAAQLGVEDSFDPAQNIDGGVRYLAMQLRRFGDVRLALAAYNAGPAAVMQHQGIPPYAETQTYVRRVLDYYASGSMVDTRA